MQLLKAAFQEIRGLFVDDGSFALLIVVWVALSWLLLPQVEPGSAWAGIIFFAGLIAILVESVLRRARNG